MDQLRLGVIDATVLTARIVLSPSGPASRAWARPKTPLPLPAIGIVTLERKIKETGASKESTPDGFEEP